MLVQTSTAMKPLSWSESICVPSVDSDRPQYQRSASVWRQEESAIRRKDGVHFEPAMSPSGFAESAVCYVNHSGSTSRRHFRSTVRYSGSTVLRPRRFFETCYVIPRSLSTFTYTSLVESQPVTNSSKHRWYSSALKLVPRQPKCSGQHEDRTSVIKVDNSDSTSATVSHRPDLPDRVPQDLASRCDENENKTFRMQLVVNGGPQTSTC